MDEGKKGKGNDDGCMRAVVEAGTRYDANATPYRGKRMFLRLNVTHRTYVTVLSLHPLFFFVCLGERGAYGHGEASVGEVRMVGEMLVFTYFAEGETGCW